MTKTCHLCKIEKQTSEFYFLSRGRHHSYCKKCDSKRNKVRHKDAREEIVKLKGGRCVLCGYDKFIGALHFHHLDPSEKDFSFGKIMNVTNSVLKEIDKCVLICGNCHSEVHAGVTQIPAGLAKRYGTILPS